MARSSRQNGIELKLGHSMRVECVYVIYLKLIY